MGKDCTETFDEIHKWVSIEAMLRNCVVGKLAPTPPKHGHEPPLDLVRWAPVTLLQKTQLSRTCILLRFGFAAPAVGARSRLQHPTSIAEDGRMDGTTSNRTIAAAASSSSSSSGGSSISTTTVTAAGDDDGDASGGSRSAGERDVLSEAQLPPPPSLAACGGCPGQHLELRWQGTPTTGAVVRQ